MTRKVQRCVCLLMGIALLPINFARGATTVRELKPGNKSLAENLTTVDVAKVRDGYRFKIQIDRKKAVAPRLSAHLEVRQQGTNVVACQLAENMSRNHISYDFFVASGLLKDSRFTFTQDDPDYPRVDRLWLVLADFVSTPGPPQSP